MILLLKFSTSHYCRKARLALGYKQIPDQVENLSPDLHILKIKPLAGLTTMPVLLPQEQGQRSAIALLNSEQLSVNSEQWTVNSEQWTVLGTTDN